jgi:hypothetical protein
LYIVVLTIPASPLLESETGPQDISFAIIRQVTLDAPNTHVSPEIPTYIREGLLDVVDIKSVQCVVGRVKDHRGRWALVDRSGPLAHPIFADDDDD